MNKFSVLLKYNVIRLLAPFTNKKQTKSSTKVGIMTVLLLGLGILALYSVSAWSMFQGLGALGLSKICVYHACMTAFSCLLILSIMRAGTTKKNNDEDLLLSLPIKKFEIIASKALGSYLFDFFFGFLLIVPYIVCFLIFEGFSISILLLMIATVLLLPLMSVGLSYVLQYVFSNLFNKIRFGNILKCGLIILLFAVLMIFIIFRSTGYGSINPADINAYFDGDFISKQIMNFMLAPDLVSVLFVLAITIIPFVFGVYLLSMVFGKPKAVYSSSKKDVKFEPKKSALLSLYKKEIGTYTGSLAFISNTILGPVFMIAIGVMVNIIGIGGVMAKIGVPVVALGDLGFGFAVIVLLMFLSLTFITCSTVSLEGTNLWILKSCPVNEKHILLAKALLQLSITTPAILISSVLLLIALKLTLVQFILLLFVPFMYSVLTAFGGLLINLIFPKFDWENDTQVVKQSIASLITMFGSMVLAVVPIFVYLYLISNITTVCLIALGFYTLLSVAAMILTFTFGVRRFRKI